jgi:osmotically-inducible protein OsmY
MNKSKIILLCASTFLMTGCAPAIIGGTAATGLAVTKEKGISGSLTDSQISTVIKYKLYQKDPDLHRRVNVNVQNTEVMLTGAVPDHRDHIAAVKIAWEASGVTRVIDNISESEGASVATFTKDSWITTNLKSKLFLESDIQSRNYSIKTVSGQVYLMGIAQSQDELDKVVNAARNTNGVEKVISYVKIKDASHSNPDVDQSDESAAEAATEE